VEYFLSLMEVMNDPTKVREVTTVAGRNEPMVDYIVKESYYFAPSYDQYDTKQTVDVEGTDVYQPGYIDLPQKVCNPDFAVGRYFGVAFGSFLFDSPSTRKTRGEGGLLKLFSFRPVTQLFSFETDSGYVEDGSGSATELARLKNTVTNGLLTKVDVVIPGSKYVSAERTTVQVHPTLDPTEQGYFYDDATAKFADTPMYLLTSASDDIVSTVSKDLVPPLSTPQHAEQSIILGDDIGQEQEVYRASSKTTLRRSAGFQLRMVHEASKRLF